MNYSLRDNGIDSLKAAYKNIIEIDEGATADHYFKDSIIFLNHANEILLKYLIGERSQALLFTDIDKYIKAKEKAIKESKDDVFDVEPNLRTITLEEAIKRTEYACDLIIPKELKGTIHELLKLRNKIMHYGLKLETTEVVDLVDRLIVCYEESVNFFSIHIENFQTALNESRFSTQSIETLRRKYDEILGEMEEAAIRASEEGYQDYLADQYDALERYAIKSGKSF